MDQIISNIKKRLASSRKVLVGLGNEWKLKEPDQRQQLLDAYRALYNLIGDKDYFIITMATDALIYETSLGSMTETVISTDWETKDSVSCSALSTADEDTRALIDRIFPSAVGETLVPDTRWQRMVAPCGNETWRQCSTACTKDIWEQGEIPDDICPHCGALLTGNTTEAGSYIEEGYLSQWNRYTRWLAGTLGKDTVILELGVDFANPGVIRFPFEKTAFFNQRSFLYRVNEKFPQITQELSGRAEGIAENSVKWIQNIGS